MSFNPHGAKLALVAAISGLAFAAASNPADAASRSNYLNAGGSCHGLEESDEMTMTRHQLYFRNPNAATKGSSYSAAVVCNFSTDIYATPKPAGTANIVKGVDLFVRKWATGTGNTKQVKCTLIGGYATSPDNYTSTKTITLPNGTSTTGGAQTVLRWNSADNGGKYLPGPVSLSCIMPSGTELNDAIIYYDAP